MNDGKSGQKKRVYEVNIFTVPHVLGEINEYFTLNTNPPSKPSEEEIINQALIFHSQGNIPEATKYYKYCIEEGFNSPRILSNYGIILKDLNNLKEAEVITRKAIEIEPDFAMAHSNLGNILRRLGNLKEAELSTRKAITINPSSPNAHLTLGNILRDSNKLNEAEISTRKAIQLKPDYSEAYNNLGKILKDLGKSKEAELSQRKAVELKTNSAEYNYNLGEILRGIRNLKGAEISTRKAIELKPDFGDAHYNLGNILKDLGKWNEAKKAYQRSLEIEPKEIHRISDLIETLSKLCMWDEIDNYMPCLNRIGIEGKAVGPLTLMNIEDNQENNLKRAIKYNKGSKIEEIPLTKHRNNNKIKIGYFSSDFRDHPVTHLLIRILELHDKSKFEIYAYSLSEIKDDYTKRVKKAVLCFREINNLSDLEIVELTRKDKIDIAIDLNGLTKLSRISIFKYRVAPIQINYLGYPGTLGTKSYDYILADKILIPEQNKKFYTENVLYLPNTFVPHDNTQKMSSYKFSRKELGLPSNGFIFTCFNHIQKITRREFKIWMSLLHKVDNSCLWLMKPHSSAMINIQNELTKSGIEKERLIFAERMNKNDHLSRHSCGDLFLDTFNYNAGTTASDSLWAGLPLITLLGKSYSARMAASILSSCDLEELITHTESEYEALAYELATNKKKLTKLSNKLKNKSDLLLFNSNNFTKELENIYINLVKPNSN